jgi:GST-like protein
MLELYHWEPNGLFLKPLVALHEKQIPFTSRYFDPTTFEHLAPSFPRNVESSLHLEREGPVLVHDGTVITSTFFMLEYIAEAFPGLPLKPAGAFESYTAQAWGQRVALQVCPAVSALGCARYLAPMLSSRDQQELRARIESIEPVERRNAWMQVIDDTYTDELLAGVRQRLKPILARFEQALRKSPWLAGAEYSIADIDAFAMLAPLPSLAPDVMNERETPAILQFLERMRERPAVRAALAMSRTGKPHEAFVPGAEPSRWG